MQRIRVIPVLLMHKGGLIKSVKFKNYRYVGDPINAVRIFNEKEIDEIIVLDIDATKENRGPDLEKIKSIASEAFIPMAYGGGVSSIGQIEKLFYLGVEKVILNYQAVNNLSLIKEAAAMFGSQSIVVSMDVKKALFSDHRVYTKNGTEKTKYDPVEFAKLVQQAGAGEIFLNSIDRDGTYNGYDLELIKRVSSKLSIPLIACGGAGKITDFKEAVGSGASAVAGGSIFVFQRPHNAVLISYPSIEQLEKQVYS